MDEVDERARYVEPEWACAECAVVWLHLADPSDDRCEWCGGAFVDPDLVIGAPLAA